MTLYAIPGSRCNFTKCITPLGSFEALFPQVWLLGKSPACIGTSRHACAVRVIYCEVNTDSQPIPYRGCFRGTIEAEMGRNDSLGKVHVH